MSLGPIWSAVGAFVVLANGLGLPEPPADARRVSGPFGEVVVWLERPPGGGLATAVGRGTIEAPPERVFAALVDAATYAEWVPFMIEAKAFPRPDGTVLHRQSLNLPFPLSDRSYDLVLRQGHDAVDSGASRADGSGERWWTRWELAPGEDGMVVQSGSWTLLATTVELPASGPESPPSRQIGTVAELRLLVDPGGPLPRFALERGALRALPWTFDGLRQQVRRWRYVEAVP